MYNNKSQPKKKLKLRLKVFESPSTQVVGRPWVSCLHLASHMGSWNFT